MGRGGRRHAGDREPGPGPGRRGRRRGGPSREGDGCARPNRLLGTARATAPERGVQLLDVRAQLARAAPVQRPRVSVVATTFSTATGYATGTGTRSAEASSSARSNHRGGGRPTRDVGNAFGGVNSRRTCSSARRTSRSPFACGGLAGKRPSAGRECFYVSLCHLRPRSSGTSSAAGWRSSRRS